MTGFIGVSILGVQVWVAAPVVTAVAVSHKWAQVIIIGTYDSTAVAYLQGMLVGQIISKVHRREKIEIISFVDLIGISQCCTDICLLCPHSRLIGEFVHFITHNSISAV